MRKIIELGKQGNRKQALKLYDKLSVLEKKEFKKFAKSNYNESTYSCICFYFNL